MELRSPRQGDPHRRRPPGATAYGYDHLNQLVEAKRGATREAFEYDHAGGLVSALRAMGEKALGWKVNAGNLVARAGNASFASDGRGRRIGKLTVDSKSPESEQETEYIRDCRDRLREVRLPDGARVVMSYDALGRRAIEQRASRREHYEIVPTQPMTHEEYQTRLNQVRFEPVPPPPTPAPGGPPHPH